MSIHKKYSGYLRDQRQFFDELITDDWQTYEDKFWDFTRQYEVKKILKKMRPISVLDVGCGCGFHDVMFAEDGNVNKVVGIDYSSKSVNQANKFYPHKKVERFCADILSKDEKITSGFDLVVSFQVIEHLEEYKLFLEKMKNKVKGGGHVVIATPNFNRLTNRVRALFSKEKVFCDLMHFKEFTIEEMQALGKELGLHYEGFFGYGFSFNFKWDIDRFIPKKVLFYLGTILPRYSNILVVTFRKI